MKKIFLLLCFVILSSCAAAQQPPLKKVIAFVQEKNATTARLHKDGSKYTYIVPAGPFELEKEYVFYVEITGCHDCRARTAKVIRWSMTTAQAQRDQAKDAEDLKNRKIY